jgi:hypothetical protein
MTYIRNPVRTFLQFLSATSEVTHDRILWYNLGQLSLALHIITVIKTLESLPVVTEGGRQEAIAVLQTILTDLDLADDAYELYEKLGEWRRPTFEAEPSPEGTSGAGVEWTQAPRLHGLSSPDDVQPGRPALSERLLEGRLERRSPDGPSTSESEE